MKLTEQLRLLLKQPLGPVVADASQVPRGRLITCIGDMASDQLIQIGLNPKVIVYDGFTARRQIGISKAIEDYEGDVYEIDNPAGSLNKEVIDLFEGLYRKDSTSKVHVLGEEDLTTLAAIRFAPTGSMVVYGQPNKGLVLVDVDEKIRLFVEDILRQMENGD